MPSRRALLLGLALVPFAAARAVGADALAAAMRDAVGTVEPVDGGIRVTAPAVAENGAVVPLTVAVDSPMTEASHVRAIHVFATRNPTPGVASFRLSPALARAELQTRIRLAEDQTIIVLAQLSDGTVRRVTAEVTVTTGGCLT
jgi:sulfur-oxidizing protein SoxY